MDEKLKNASVIHICANNFTMDADRFRLIDPKAKFVEVKDIEKRLSGCILPSNVSEGDILFRHPFLPSTFVDANFSEVEFFNQKIKSISKVCQELGATHIEAHAKWLDTKIIKKCIGGKITYYENPMSDDEEYTKTKNQLGVTFATKFRKSEKERIEKEYRLIENYPGASNFNSAIEVSKTRGLGTDFDVQDLISKRMSANPIKNQTVKINLSRELTQAKSIAFGLIVATQIGPFGLGMRFGKSVSTLNEVEMEFHVDF